MGGKSSYSGPSAAEIEDRNTGLEDKWTEQRNVEEAQKEAFELQLEQEFELLAEGDKAREVQDELSEREGAAGVLSAGQTGFKRDSKSKEELVSLLAEEEEDSILGGI